MFKKNIKISILIIFFSLLVLVAVNSASASFLNSDLNNKIGNSAQNVGLAGGYETSGSNDQALIVVQTVINVFLSVIGVLLLVYILYAGYNWLTAQGEEEKVEKAKETIKRAIVGAIIIVAAYAIGTFVISRLEAGSLSGAGGGSVGGYTSQP